MIYIAILVFIIIFLFFIIFILYRRIQKVYTLLESFITFYDVLIEDFDKSSQEFNDIEKRGLLNFEGFVDLKQLLVIHFSRMERFKKLFNKMYETTEKGN